MYPIIIWLLVTVFFILLELAMPGLFYFLSFAIGASIAALSSLFMISIPGQLLIFALISLVSFVLLKQWVRSIKPTPETYSNTQALIGKHGTVQVDIRPEKKGFVKVQGEVWSAYASTGDILLAGMIVEIVAVKGSHVLVKPKYN